MVITLLKNDLIDKIWHIVENYTDFILYASAVDSSKYSGTEFCKGLHLGASGSKTLLLVAKSIQQLVEN
jgi:hypothetical protein